MFYLGIIFIKCLIVRSFVYYDFIEIVYDDESNDQHVEGQFFHCLLKIFIAATDVSTCIVTTQLITLKHLHLHLL